MSRGEGTACLDGFADYPINISDTMPSVGYGVSRSGENSGGESVNTSSVFVTASASPALSTRQKHALLVQQRRAAAAGGSRAAAAADALGSDSDADDADIVDTNIHFTTGLLNAIGGAELPAHVDIARLSILPVGLGSGTGSSSGLLGASNPHAAGRPQTNGMRASVSTSELRIVTSAAVQSEEAVDITTQAARDSENSIDDRVKLARSASSGILLSPLRTSSRRNISNGAVASPLEPVMRDHYGFARSFQYFSREDYQAFDRYYNGILDRRSTKWDMMLRKNGGVLPARSDKLKRYIRKGIPRHLREACWFHYSGAEKYLANNPGLYSMLVYREMQDRQMGFTKERNKILEFIDVLERDLHRTFPENILFNEKSGMSSAPSGDNLDDNPTSPSSPVAPIVTPHVHSLRRLLVAFAYYSWPHPDDSRTPPKQCSYRIGYCQSLNFVAGLILLIFLPNPNDPPNVNSPLSPTSVKSSRPASSTVFRNPEEIEEETRLLAEERAFWMLVATVERLLPPEMYGSNLEGAQVAQEVLWKWLLGERGKRFGVGKMADWVETMEGGEPTGIRKSRSRRGGGAGTSSGNGMPPLSLVTTSWFMTVFINVLPIETVLRVWDCFTYQGEKVLMRVTLTLLKIHEDEVLACNDTTDAWRLIKEIPPRMIDAHKLMDICFKPRVNLSLFDSESSSSLLHIGSPSMSRQSSDAHLHDSDDDYDGRSSVGSIHPRSTVGGALQIQNDPLRKWGSSTLSSGGKVSGGGKVPKRGVGSVSTKMIEHYRALALQERRSK